LLGKGFGRKRSGEFISSYRDLKKSGITPIVCINHFYTDADDEINIIKRAVEGAGVQVTLSKKEGIWRINH